MFNFFKKKEDAKIIIASPVKGKAISLSEVNDPTFSECMLGKGAAVIPSEGNIYAPADGYVVLASRQSGYGNFIMIKHSNNLYTCYGHLNSYKVSAGQTVKRGQAIALSGSTGVSTGPHLHWEVRTSSSYSSRVNPLNYISDSVYSQLDFHC